MFFLPTLIDGSAMLRKVTSLFYASQGLIMTLKDNPRQGNKPVAPCVSGAQLGADAKSHPNSSFDEVNDRVGVRREVR